MSVAQLSMLPPVVDLLHLLRHNAPPLGIDGAFSCTDAAALRQLATAERSGNPATPALRKHHRIYRALFAPIRKLPAELLLEIFAIHAENARATRDTRRRFRRRRADIHPLLDTVAHVCALWRELVLGSPSLWSKVTVLGQQFADPETRRAATAGIQAVMERAGQAPLDIVIKDTREEALDAVADSVERWHEAHFAGLATRETVLHLQGIVRGRLLSLRKLRLATFATDIHDEWLSFLEDAEQLRELSVTGQLLLSILPKTIYRLTSLTCTANVASINSCVRYMQILPPSLVYTLAFYSDFVREELVVDIAPTISHITRLILQTGNFDTEQGRAVFRAAFVALTLPDLRELTFAVAPSSTHARAIPDPIADEWDDEPGVHAYDAPFPWLHEAFLSLAARSGFSAHLLSLDIRDVHIAVPKLLECLRVLAALETLAIADHPRRLYAHIIVTNPLLRALSASAADAPAPRLRTINLCSTLVFDDRVFLAFLRTRLSLNTSTGFACHVRAIPEYFRPFAKAARHSDLQPDIDSLRQAGLRLSWVDSPGYNSRRAAWEEEEEDDGGWCMPESTFDL